MTRKATYLGPRLKVMRRELGLTQANMAADLEISPSYIALMERNQRPVTAELLVRLASTYRIDIADLASAGGEELSNRLQGVLNDPMFADIDLPALDIADIAASFPGMAEAMIRLHTAFSEERLALADRADDTGHGASDPVAEARAFLAARRNFFPALDESAGRLATTTSSLPELEARIAERHGLEVRYADKRLMAGAVRWHDYHRGRIFLAEWLGPAGRRFQLALQLALLEEGHAIETLLEQGRFASDDARQLVRHGLQAYWAAALLMPYDAFRKAAIELRHDIDLLAARFSVSFEQAAHRLTTLQRPGAEGVPFFFLRVDQAGNVSKRLDGAGFPFARHAGGCPLWNIHSVFTSPGRPDAQLIELPDGERFLSVARTVRGGAPGFGVPQAMRAIALVCSTEHRGQAPMLTIDGITVRLGGRAILERASATVPHGRARGPDRPQRGRQVHPDEGADRRDRAGRRRNLQAVPRSHRLYRAGSTQRVHDARTDRAGRRPSARPAGGGGNLHRSRPAGRRARTAARHRRLQRPGARRQDPQRAGLRRGNAAAPVDSFSGGWKMRVALGALLFSEPDILLLDEPSNHLDLEATLWLENFLKSYPATLVVISHERDLLNKVVDHILHLQGGQLTLYPGGYDAFEKQRAERAAQLAAAKASQDAQRARLQDYVARNSARASTAKQAQSRAKMLAKMQPIAALMEDPSLSFDFPDPGELKSADDHARQAAVGYGDGAAGPARLNLRIDPDDRIALLGRNGNGKTTLARLLAAQLTPADGGMNAPGKLKVGYFTQYQVEELAGDDTPLEHMTRAMEGKTPGAVRAQLGGSASPGRAQKAGRQAFGRASGRGWRWR
jgi:XRE family transcriptional regulator, fatty acid utilization regulator